MLRRDILKMIGTGVAFGTLAGTTHAKQGKGDRSMQTYVYKKVGDLEIKADVHGSGSAGQRKPVIVAIHGGALILGSRTHLSRRLFDPILEKGYVVVSIDYRLAPETKIAGIIEDLRDAFRWVRDKGPGLFGADPQRFGVHGGSAGGYLTLMAGFCIEPRPKALVSFYGYGDITADWYAKPSPHYCQQPAITKEQAYAAINDKQLAEYDDQRRGQFYLYCRQKGLWPREVAGFDPKTEPDKFKPFCPAGNVTPDYPPTLLAHGTNDNDVPYSQSVQMANEFTRIGVPHEFIPLHHADHGFGGANPTALANAFARAIGFLTHYV